MDAAELGHVVLVVLATAGCVLYKAGAENGNDDVVERNDLGLRKKALKDSGLYVEAPAAAVNLDVKRPSLFLGGGISGCFDWQSVIVDQASQRCPNLCMINPRRDNFDVADTKATEIQIIWEHEWLRKVTAVMFWFPPETLCPITLYELGTWTILSQTTGTKLFIGCHPEYKRKEDVIIQTKLVNPDIKVAESIDDILVQIEEWYSKIN